LILRSRHRARDFVAALYDVVLDVGIFGKLRCKIIPFVSFDLTPGGADALGVSKRQHDFRICQRPKSKSRPPLMQRRPLFSD